MSGDSAVALAGSASATRLVAALSDIAAVDPQFVLVGGLAVMARLAQAHRATEDLDTLVGGVSFTRAVAMLPTGSDIEGVLRVRDVKVDTIDDPETVLRRLRGMGASAAFVTLDEIKHLADLVASAFAD